MLGGALVLGSSLGCRIYREDRRSRDTADISPPVPTAREPDRIPDKAPVPAPPQTPAADSLSLWVLNRSERDLVASPPESPGPDPAKPPPALALVALGLGRAPDCAEGLAHYALQQSEAIPDPVRATAQILEALMRFRWPEPEATFSALLRSSERKFGAIQSARAAVFSPALLDLAVRRHVVLDGLSSRWGVAGPPPAAGALESTNAGAAACEAGIRAGLRGPVGVLLRSASGQFYVGLGERVTPSDAGVASLVTQYGVSAAAGADGGVLLVADCPSLPDAAMAENLYPELARREREPVPRAEEPRAPGCLIAHALATRTRAWVTGAPLAWASASADSLGAGDAGMLEREGDPDP
jgi:hypothetical protein